MSNDEANTSRATANEGEGSEIPCDVTSDDVTVPWKFKKTKGCADMGGELFEVKMLALIFLQALRTTEDFSLANNLVSAGLFDDIIFVDKLKETAYFLQLNHNGSVKEFGYSMLTSSNGKFGLIKYLHTYRKIKIDHMDEDEDLLQCGRFESIKYLFFTNCHISKNVYSDDKEVTRVDDLFKTGGKTFRLNIDGRIGQDLKAMDIELSDLKQLLEKLQCDINDRLDVDQVIIERLKHKTDSKNQEISQRIQRLMQNPCKEELKNLLNWDEFQDVRDDETRNEFLNKLLLCTDQPNESDLDKLIKSEIRNFWISSSNEVDAVYEGVVEGVQTWWKQREGAIALTPTSRIWTNALHRRTRREYLQPCGISFLETCTQQLWDRITLSTSQIVAVLIKGDIPTLTSIKFLPPLDLPDNALDKSVFITLRALLEEKKKILKAFKRTWCNILVVECGSPIELDVANKLGEELKYIVEKKKVAKKKKVVLITRRDHALIEAIKQLTNDYDVYEDDSKWQNLRKESQDFLLTKQVSFQGESLPLGDVIGSAENLLSKIDVVTLGMMLRPDKLQLGKRLQDSISFYVPRRLGKNLKPVTVLSDVAEKVVLVVGQPGMGKSTLLTELAKETKRSNPSLWIVRLDLADCSEYLQDLEPRNIINGVEFLRKFAFNSCRPTPFEEALFTHCLTYNKILILLDGVDEVTMYKDKVLEIMGKLAERKFTPLWVTSRSVVQKDIESILHINANILAPFSKLDQVNFLTEFWKLKNPNVEPSSLKAFVDALLDLADNSLRQHSTTLSGVPQLIGMMADIYDSDLKEYSNGSIDLPKNLDLQRLFHGIVEKKHASYYKDKKQLDPRKAAIPANKDEKNKHFRSFLSTHMHAALHFYFDPVDYVRLGIGNEIKTSTQQFYEQIKDGLEMTGIIDGMTPAGKPRFIHRMFMEYFVALWINENYMYIRDFSRNRLFDSNFKLVNELLNRIMANNSPLHVSTLNRDSVQVDNLLKSGSETVDKTDGGVRTALHLVVLTYEHDHRSSHVAITRSLLSHSALLTLTDDMFVMRPLQLADRTEAWPLAGLILQHGGDPTDMETTRHNTGEDFEELLEFLRHPSEDVTHLIEIATKHGILSLLHYLVDDYSGDVHLRLHDDDETLLQDAALAGLVSRTRRTRTYRQEKGLSYTSEDSHLNSPLQHTAKGGNNKTLMHVAAQAGHVSVMTYLQEKGLSYTSEDSHLNSPLHYAAKGGSYAAVQFLVNFGCHVDVLNVRGETPLMIAAGWAAADLNVIEFLASSGAVINARNHDLLTPLDYAILSEKFAIVRWLISCGVVKGRSDSEKLLRRIDELERIQSLPPEHREEASETASPEALEIVSYEYNMNHERRGHAIIFSHEHFDDPSLRPRGAEIDANVASETFLQLGFEVSVHRDLPFDEIKRVLKELREEDHSKADCLVIVVLSHGEGDGTDARIYAKDIVYPRDFLWQSFTPANCPSLTGKPKIFFIQGCRGDLIDTGVELKSYKASHMYSIPEAADFLIADSTAKGSVSDYTPIADSWYIRALCQELRECGTTTDLLKILTRTARRVTTYYEGHTTLSYGGHEVPVVLNMLTRDVFFRPKRPAPGKETTDD